MGRFNQRWDRRRVASVAVAVALAIPALVCAQETPPPPVADHTTVSVSEILNLRMTDTRLAAAMQRLVSGSEMAAGVMDSLLSSGLVVAIGTPKELAALPDSEGGPALGERRALLADVGDAQPSDGPPIAWVVFRVGEPAPGARPGSIGMVERVWIAVEIDSVESWIHAAGWSDAAERIDNDLVAILAHEFVAHVGSISRSKDLADFCDDPLPYGDPDALACSIQVENQVRHELNRGLDLSGSHRLPERRTYALDVMNFAQAYLRIHR